MLFYNQNLDSTKKKHKYICIYLDDEPTYPCKVCGRKFIRSSLVRILEKNKKFLKQKHEPACKKITKMHRKVFDSGKQRAANSDIPYKDIKKVIKEKEKVCICLKFLI